MYNRLVELVQLIQMAHLFEAHFILLLYLLFHFIIVVVVIFIIIIITILLLVRYFGAMIMCSS